MIRSMMAPLAHFLRYGMVSGLWGDGGGGEGGRGVSAILGYGYGVQ